MRRFTVVVFVYSLLMFASARKKKLSEKDLSKRGVFLPLGFNKKSIKKSCFKISAFSAKKLFKSKKVSKKKILCAFISFQANAGKLNKLSPDYENSTETLSRFKRFSRCVKQISEERQAKGKILKDLIVNDNGHRNDFIGKFEKSLIDPRLRQCDLYKKELDALDWLSVDELEYLGIIFPDPDIKVPRFCLDSTFHKNAGVRSISPGSPDERYYCAFASFQARDDRISGKYADYNEARMRFELFKENVDWVNEHNQQEGVTWSVEVNMMSDLRPDERFPGGLMIPANYGQGTTTLGNSYVTHGFRLKGNIIPIPSHETDSPHMVRIDGELVEMRVMGR